MKLEKVVDLKKKEVSFIFRINEEELRKKGYIEENGFFKEVEVDKIVGRVEEILGIKNRKMTMFYGGEKLVLEVISWGFSKKNGEKEYELKMDLKIINEL